MVVLQNEPPSKNSPPGIFSFEILITKYCTKTLRPPTQGSNELRKTKSSCAILFTGKYFPLKVKQVVNEMSWYIDYV